MIRPYGKLPERIDPAIEKIDPYMAHLYLQMLRPNYNHLQYDKVGQYAAAMKAGWVDDDPKQAIAFDTLGRLINGRHRLEAIVKSGVTVKLYVVHGIPIGSHPHFHSAEFLATVRA